MKKILFYTSCIALIPLILLKDMFTSIFEVLTRASAVLDVVLARYEHWAFNVPKDTFFNCPWKRTLKQEYNRERTL